MAVVNKQWSNGDTLAFDMNSGGILVSSAPNLTGAPRSMAVNVKTTAGNPQVVKVLNVEQAMRTSKLYQCGYIVSPEIILGNSFIQADLNSDWSSISSGQSHTLAIRNGRLYSWGDDLYGKLGILNQQSGTIPTQVGVDTDWQMVAAGQGHSLAIKNGKLYAWGWNIYGQLGLGDNNSRYEPTQVGFDSDWQMIAVGGNHSLGIKGGRLYAWGFNQYYGSLGLGDLINRNVPTQVGTATDWQFVSAGGWHSLGIRSGKLFSWGFNSSGQLGLNHSTNVNTPTQVGAYSDWSYVAGANPGSSSFGIRGGKLYACGSNYNGQLGLGNNTSVRIFNQIGSDTDWEIVKGSGGHTLGIKAGKLYSWGLNDYYQLGLGDNINRNAPVLVDAENNIYDIAAGDNFSIVLKSN